MHRHPEAAIAEVDGGGGRLLARLVRHRHAAVLEQRPHSHPDTRRQHQSEDHPRPAAWPALTLCPCACSGERYWAVPMIEPVSVISDAPARAMPKSVTFTFPCGPTITLCGLKSRWITPRLWAKPAARRIWMPRSMARSCVSGASRLMRSLRVSPCRNSIAM